MPREARASGAMNGAVDAAAAEQRLVGGIDDGVDIKPGDVAFDDLDAVRHGSIGRPKRLPIKVAVAGDAL